MYEVMIRDGAAGRSHDSISNISRAVRSGAGAEWWLLWLALATTAGHWLAPGSQHAIQLMPAHAILPAINTNHLLLSSSDYTQPLTT